MLQHVGDLIHHRQIHVERKTTRSKYHGSFWMKPPTRTCIKSLYEYNENSKKTKALSVPQFSIPEKITGDFFENNFPDYFSFGRKVTQTVLFCLCSHFDIYMCGSRPETAKIQGIKLLSEG
jgi:hypothetical protein